MPSKFPIEATQPVNCFGTLYNPRHSCMYLSLCLYGKRTIIAKRSPWVESVYACCALQYDALLYYKRVNSMPENSPAQPKQQNSSPGLLRSSSIVSLMTLLDRKSTRLNSSHVRISY